MQARPGVIVLSALFFVMVCGCQPTPDAAVVTSKNDGALEAALETAADTRTDTSREPEAYTDSFTNTDGNIYYHVELETPAITTDMPVLRVRPETITAETAKRVAGVLFGDADIYEYSETAEAVPCGWEFHPRSWYIAREDLGIPVIQEPVMIGDSKSLYIAATAERDGLPYIYTVCNREEDDYRFHGIACAIDGGLPDDHGTQMPTEEELAEAQAETEDMISAMELGEWVIDSCDIEHIPSAPGESAVYYTIVVTACPVYRGVKVSHLLQMAFLNTEDAYASDYYYEEMVFTFSGGRLTSFRYTSPLEVAEVVNENAAILSFDEAMAKCRTRLELSILNADPFSPEGLVHASSKYIDIYRAELGLARIRVKDSAADFYLIPAYVFRASYALYDRSGSFLFSSDDLEPRTMYASELLVVNALDGSIINTEFGY